MIDISEILINWVIIAVLLLERLLCSRGICVCKSA